MSTMRPLLLHGNGSRVMPPIVGIGSSTATPAPVNPLQAHDITPQSRPPIIVPLTQVYRSSSTTTSTTTTASPQSSSTSTTSADNLIPGESSVVPNVTQRTPSVAVSAITSSTIAQSSTTTSKPVPSKPTPVIPEVNDNNIYNRNVESETMGSIGSIQTFDMSDSAYCPPVTFRDIRWPPTRPGTISMEACPPPTHGQARWECTNTGLSATWMAQPDLSECTSFWVHNLRSRVESGDSVMSVASELALKTRNTKLYGGDIIQSIQLMQSLVNRMGSSVGDIQEDKRHQLVKDLIQSVIEVSSNVLESRNREGWFDLGPQSRRSVASQLIHGLESAALLLAATGQYDFNRAHTNVLVSVRLVDAKVSGVKEMHFPTEDTVVNTAWMVMQESLTLPLQTSITSTSSKPGVLKVVFLAYRNVQDFLTPLNISVPTVTAQSSPLSLSAPTASTGPSTLSPSRRVINSKVMTLSLVGETNNAFNIRLAQPIQLQFKHLIEENTSNPQCVYWDYNIR